ncbi:unnamed protein product [Amaranthus hypochondriacus]
MAASPIVYPRHWKHLATTSKSIYSDEFNSNYIIFDIEPERFKQFVRNFKKDLWNPFFNGGKGKVNAIYYDGLDSDLIPPIFVKLHFKFCYSLRQPSSNKPLIFTDINAKSLLDSGDLDDLDFTTVTPVCACLKFTPYDGFNFLCVLDKEVDIDLYIQWVKHPQTSDSMFRIKFRQEKIPIQTVPNDGLLSWIHLGRNQYVNDNIRLNAFQFEGETVEEFLKSFPAGRLKNRIDSGLGIRVGNVYTSYRCSETMCVLTGLEMKVMDSISHGGKVLILNLQNLLQLNPEFNGKHVHTYYRWSNESLELRFLILRV